MIDLSGKTAVVTGSGSGIGRGIAIKLAGLGARVAVADLDPEGAKQTVDAVEAGGGVAAAFEVDVANFDSVVNLRNEVKDTFGTASIIVNNAGWDRILPFLETEPDFWRKVVDVNYLGVVAVSQAFAKDLVAEGGRGHLVNVASDAGRVGSLGETVYAGAKGGVIAFTKSLARELARHSINVNCVAPGPTDTPLFYQQPEKVRDALIRAIPFRKLGQPEDIANTVAFLGSDEASYITGQVISVSGGLTMAG